ncbi:zinc finger and BTB domain-containing protein 22b [Entelurus aequoreus]|uniref:zinc finger and BTB domain-containing protein 22b n=1 Tax=Entelurus aequoreus TaxID=161455 RepID=UPI002B1DDDF7|nr:zinc finger and BTB domain-containing protein 22b [Entelurus aequoreus]XP_061903393.1 zinc finger and BTB domain-containing protein 22b [Entelurus aequoreus]
MQSTAVEVGDGSVLQVCFPSTQASVLDSLNQQREDGRLCDLAIHVQGHVFKAHRCVLAASSPYFHDQVLLKNMSTVSIPAVMDPLAFESVLSCAYTGQLRMLREDIVNYLTVGSVLQMWHIVDKCTELLKEGRAAGGGASGGGGVPQASGGGVSAIVGYCSSNGVAGGSDDSHGSRDQARLVASQETSRASQPPNHLSVSESQSPSSTNYFSPRDGGAVTAGTSVEGGMASNTPSYCTPSGEEAFMIEEDEEDEAYHQKKRGRGGGSGCRKKTNSVSEEEVSDGFGVSSYQDEEDSSESPLQKRPAYIQPSIMPRKQWVVVKTEQAEDDDLIVVSGEEGGGEEEDDDEEDERGVAPGRDRDGGDFGISHVRTLSAEAGGRAESDMDAQMDYCQSSEDFLKFEGSLLDPSLAHHLHENSAGQNQNSNRAVSALLGQVQAAATARAQLYPLDMQGNQLLVYGQTPGLSMDAAAPPPLGMAGAMMVGASFKGPSVEHGPAHLSAQGSLGGEGADGSGVSMGKVFMCHCGKTFTHKSMRDRHINMHLDLRPFHCPVCAKKFKMKHHLTEHMKTHTGLKPYDCVGCGRKFMWRDSFMRHRSHCERRGGPSQGCDSGLRGGAGDDVSDLNPANHLLPPGEGGLGGGGRGGVSASGSSGASMMATGALVGVSSSSHGSGMFGGPALGHTVCSDRACEVGANDSVT